MQKERGFRIIAVIALMVAVVGLTIGYAAYSSTLKITGAANVDPSSWNVKFAYKTGSSLVAAKTGKAVVNTEATLSDTQVSGFNATLKAPGDSITYNFLVTNSGSLDAELSTFTMGTISCAPASGSNATTEEANAICSELSYTLTGVTASDRLAAGESKDLTLKLEWASTGTAVASDDIAITVGETTLIYTQA